MQIDHARWELIVDTTLCSMCGARPGHMCTTPRGNVLLPPGIPHKARVEEFELDQMVQAATPVRSTEQRITWIACPTCAVRGGYPCRTYDHPHGNHWAWYHQSRVYEAERLS